MSLLLRYHRVVIACVDVLQWVVRRRCAFHGHSDLLLLEVSHGTRVQLPFIVGPALFRAQVVRARLYLLCRIVVYAAASRVLDDLPRWSLVYLLALVS